MHCPSLVGTFIFLEKLLRKHAGPATHCTDARRRRLRPCCTPSRPRGFPRWTGGLHVCSFEFTDRLLVPGPTGISPGSAELSRSYGIWRSVILLLLLLRVLWDCGWCVAMPCVYVCVGVFAAYVCVSCVSYVRWRRILCVPRSSSGPCSV